MSPIVKVDFSKHNQIEKVTFKIGNEKTSTTVISKDLCLSLQAYLARYLLKLLYTKLLVQRLCICSVVQRAVTFRPWFSRLMPTLTFVVDVPNMGNYKTEKFYFGWLKRLLTYKS